MKRILLFILIALSIGLHAEPLPGEGDRIIIPTGPELSLSQSIAEALVPGRFLHNLQLFRSSTLEAFRQASVIMNTIGTARGLRQDFAMVVDYNLGADQPRLFTFQKIVNGNQATLEIQKFHVAHGGGNEYATNFELRMSRASSTEGTGLSSPGAYIVYQTKNSTGYGPAFFLEGLEPAEAAGFGFSGNSRAFTRHIILHRQRVVVNQITQENYLGATRGCFGISDFGVSRIYNMILGLEGETSYEDWDRERREGSYVLRRFVPSLLYSYWTRPN